MKRATIYALFTGAAALLLSGALAQNLPRNETLYVTGHQWGPPSSFNPLGPVRAWPINEGGAFNLIYESLFTFNLVTGELDPRLGETLEETPESFVVTLHEGTAFHDGEPLTADDVVYSYELAQRHPVEYTSFWDYVTAVEATDERTVTFTLNQERLNLGLVRSFLTTVAILPEHLWTELEASEDSLVQFANPEPVGSGPYRLMSANNERIILERVDNYWGEAVYGQAGPRYQVHPIFASNDAANLAFSQGQLDLSQNFIPEVWTLAERGIRTWTDEPPYYLPGTIPLLWINVHEPGLDNPEVRRALAYSINYPLIAETAMSNYSVPANASLIIPGGAEDRFFDAEAVASSGWRFDPNRAVEILEGLGATRGGDGIYVLPDGTRLGPWEVSCPYGWSDWNQALEIVASSAQAVGIDLRTNFPEQSVWQTNMQNGNFQLAMNTAAGASAAAPWPRFRDVLDIRGVPPAGQTAFWNYGRYDNPDVAELLDQAAAASPEEQGQFFAQLDEIFRADIPAIPLMYRPQQFYTFNEAVWSGFPTAENPYAPPMHSQSGVQVLFNISAAE
jgi:peptide/nickel transport system substrate-binding protein